MAIRKPLVVIDGVVRQLPTSDSMPPPPTAKLTVVAADGFLISDSAAGGELKVLSLTAVQNAINSTLVSMGASPLGAIDSTTALVDAITAAKTTGTGVVTIPKGAFLITTGGIHLSDIALVGAGIPETNGAADAGSIFLLDSLTTSPFILDTGWKLDGITFYYPNQTGTASPTAYPPLFTGTYCAGAVMNNCCVVNAYQVFKFDAGVAVGDMRLHQCRIYGIDKVFWFTTGVTEVLHISECLFSYGVFTPSFTPNTHLRDFTTLYGEFMTIDVGAASYTSIDGLNLGDSIIYGYRFGLRVLSGLLNVSTVHDSWFDAVGTALSVEGTASVANSRWHGNYHWTGRPGFPDAITPTMSFTTSASSLQMFMDGNDLVYSHGNHVYAPAALGELIFTNNRVANWGQSTYATPTHCYGLLITDPVCVAHISGNSFKASAGAVAHPRIGIKNTNSAVSTIDTNTFYGCYYSIWVVNAGKAYLNSNTVTAPGNYSLRNDAASGVVESRGNKWNGTILGAQGETLVYARAATQTFTGAKTAVVFGDGEIQDKDLNFASNVFTATVAGDYDVLATLGNTTGLTVASIWTVSVEQAGSAANVFRRATYVPVNATLAAGLTVHGLFSLAVGDTVTTYVTRIAGSGNYVSINDASYNYITVKGL